jgi:hypothetical protein
MLGGHRSDDDVAAVLANAFEIENTSNIDAMCRDSEAESNQGDLAVPARNGTCIFAQTAKQTDGFLDR